MLISLFLIIIIKKFLLYKLTHGKLAVNMWYDESQLIIFHCS